MKRRTSRTIESVLYMLLLLVGLLPGLAEARVALVIGNSGYEHQPLQNPLNDAEDMRRVLEKLGFEVTLHLDLDLRGMNQAILRFTRQLRTQQGVGLFYYAGHGVEVNGGNYLIPLGAEINAVEEVPYEALHLGRLLDLMEGARSDVNVIIVDACRNNPFARGLGRDLSNRGLGRVEAALSGSVIASSTASGEIAADGSVGRNSPYTRHLLEQMQAPGLEIGPMLRRVSAGVQRDTDGSQQPWVARSLTEDFYFVPPEEKPGQVVLAVRATPSDAGVRLMNSVRRYQEGMQLPPGSYDIEVSREGYRTHRETYTLAAGERVIGVELQLEESELDPEPDDGGLAAVLGRPVSADASDENGWTDLHYAAVLNRPELITALVEAGARVDVRLLSDSEDLSDQLTQNLHELKIVSDPDDWENWTRDGESPLHMAAYVNAREAVSRLIDLGASIEEQNSYGKTPLHFAANQDARETVQLLLQQGANIEAKNINGYTPLHIAANQDARETVQLLLQQGANIEAKSNNGKTPLHFAANQDARETVQLLLQQGANIEAKSNNGKTPLHFAANQDARETVQLLLQQGANIEAKNINGYTPLQIAERKGNHITAEVFPEKAKSDGPEPEMMDRQAFKQFCEKNSRYGCFSIRTRDECAGCDLPAVRRLWSELNVRVSSWEIMMLGRSHKPGCVGFRSDLGGTREMAELVRSVLGSGYYIGRECTSDGFPINVHALGDS